MMGIMAVIGFLRNYGKPLAGILLVLSLWANAKTGCALREARAKVETLQETLDGANATIREQAGAITRNTEATRDLKEQSDLRQAMIDQGVRDQEAIRTVYRLKIETLQSAAVPTEPVAAMGWLLNTAREVYQK